MAIAEAALAATRLGNNSRNLNLKWSLTLRVVAVALALLSRRRGARRLRDLSRASTRQRERRRHGAEAAAGPALPHRDEQRPAVAVSRVGPGDRPRPEGQGSASATSSPTEASGGRAASEPTGAAAGLGLCPRHAGCSARAPTSHVPSSITEKAYGTLVVTTRPSVVLAAIWKDVSGLLGLTALVIVAICLLQYVAISRALRPTE